MSADILREYDVDLSLRDSENMGPTRSELAMAAEIARLRRFEQWFDRVDADTDFALPLEDMILYYGHPRAPWPREAR
jgi:hypothetical protein